MRNMMRANQDLDIDSEIVRMPQNLDHPSDRPLALLSEIENLGR